MTATPQSTPTIPGFFSGAVQPGGSSRRIPVTSPWDNTILGELPCFEPNDIDRAVAASKSAFLNWSRLPIKDRVQPLYRFKQVVEANILSLAETVSMENGKTVAEAKAGIEKGLEVVEFACAMPQIMPGDFLEVSRGVDCRTRRYPLGVVAGITPFNFPAMVPMWMFPIALAAGNTFLLKPSEQVPLTPVRIAEFLKEAGLPENVFQVIQGDRETVENLIDHPDIAAAAFVGSTPVAKALYHRGIDAGKRMLTLGGAKNHLVVAPDADVDITARNVVSSFTGCAGQRCMAASVLIGVGNCDHVLKAICDTANQIRPGEEMGAIISEKARARIEAYIDQAEKEGAEILLDGRRPEVPGKETGNFVGPTVIRHPNPESDCLRDEIFGPVISVVQVETLDQALAIENANPYGNAAAIYTTSGGVARYFEERANAGMIGINIGVPVPREPFSFGGWNDSRFGIGDITGTDGIHFWTKTKKTTEKWAAGAASNWMS